MSTEIIVKAKILTGQNARIAELTTDEGTVILCEKRYGIIAQTILASGNLATVQLSVRGNVVSVSRKIDAKPVQTITAQLISTGWII